MPSVKADWVAISDNEPSKITFSDDDVQSWMDDIVRGGSRSWLPLIDTERMIVLQWTGVSSTRQQGALFIWVRKDLLGGSR